MPTVRRVCCHLAILVGLLCLGVGGAGAASRVEIYPALKAPGFDYGDSGFAVAVSGQPVPVRAYRPFGRELDVQDRNCCYAHFGMARGAVTLTVDAQEPITTWSVSPAAYKLAATVDGNALTIVLDRPRYLMVRINAKQRLFILADPLETDRPAATGIDAESGRTVFNVTAAPYHADRSGAVVATAALNQAFSDAAAAKGIAYIPAGTYVAGRLALKSGLWVYLEPGALLMADPDRTHWRKDSKPDSFINCGNTEGLKLFGRGVVYAGGAASCIAQGIADRDDPERLQEYSRLRIRPFHLRKVKNLTLDGLLLNESTAWSVPIEGGSHVTLSNLKVINDKKLGMNDGINITGGSDITVRRCFVSTMDDAVCLKGIYGEVRDVTIDDLVVDAVMSAIKFGMQGMSPVRNITVSDFHGIGSSKGVDISHDCGKQEYRDIDIVDSTFARTTSFPFRIVVRDKNNNQWPKGWAHISGVRLTRVAFERASTPPAVIAGHATDGMVRDVVLQDVQVGGELLTTFGPLLRRGRFVDGVRIQGRTIAE